MGLSCSCEEYNRRADAAFSSLANMVRVVDEFLHFDRDFSQHVLGVCAVLHAARTAGVTSSPDKFHYAESKLLWVRGPERWVSG